MLSENSSSKAWRKNTRTCQSLQTSMTRQHLFQSFRFDAYEFLPSWYSITDLPFVFQIQFINAVILPSFTVLEKLLPKSSEALDNIQANISRWHEKATESKTGNGDNLRNTKQTNAIKVHSPRIGLALEINDSPKTKQHHLPKTIPASSTTCVRRRGRFSDFTALLAISLRLRRSQIIQVLLGTLIFFCFAFVERLHNGETLLMFECIGTLLIQLVTTP